MPRYSPVQGPAGLLLAAAFLVASCGGDAAMGGVAGATATANPAPVGFAASTPPPNPQPTPTARPPAPIPLPPMPTATPEPTPSPTPTPEPIPTGPFSMNLYQGDDFASQVTKETCVAGAMHTMLLIGDVTDNHRDRYQLRLEALATSLSDSRPGETEPEGWARGLEQKGLGHYKVVVADTRYQAIKRAALAIRKTGRPVGLLVWRGAHSWVMHGFRATQDPLYFPDARITSVWVSDPWYPRISSIWGPSNPPNTKVKVADLKIDYLKWRRPTGRYPDKDGRFVLVIPVNR